MSRLNTLTLKGLEDRLPEMKSSVYDDVCISIRWSDREFTQKKVEEFFNILSYLNEVSNKIDLDLRDNLFNDSHMQKMSDFLNKHSNIKHLSLWMPCNSVTDKGAEVLFRAISKLKNLLILNINLEWNFQLTNQAVVSLGESLKSLGNLKELRVNMSIKTFVDEKGEEIFKGSLSDHKNLVKAFFNDKNCFVYV